METFDQMQKRKATIQRRIRYETQKAELNRLRREEKSLARENSRLRAIWGGARKVGGLGRSAINEGIGLAGGRRTPRRRRTIQRRARRNYVKYYPPRGHRKSHRRRSRMNSGDLSYWI